MATEGNAAVEAAVKARVAGALPAASRSTGTRTEGVSTGGSRMRCPYCGSEDTQVKDSRPTEDGSAIRRRRVLPDCGARFTTFERVQLRELTVVKTRRPPRALRPRQARALDRDRAAQAPGRRRNGSSAWSTASSAGSRARARARSRPRPIGEMVMEALKELDQVAYVRFACVYRNFREARDFRAFLGEMDAD